MAETCETEENPSAQHEHLSVEYFIGCPPCPRDERRRLNRSHKQSSAAHRRARAGNDEPTPRRSLPATPSTERAEPSLIDGPGEIQPRMSPFRRGQHHKRPASATAGLSEDELPSRGVVLKPRPLRVDVNRDPVSGKQVCSLQEMVRRRRTSSSSSSSSTSFLSASEHHQPQYEQVRTLSMHLQGGPKKLQFPFA